ncbi:hypothetical protein ACEQ8H_008477 [Pleosporales sp. CAS-2024a]
MAHVVQTRLSSVSTASTASTASPDDGPHARKRRLADATTPPSTLAVTQPHGALLRIPTRVAPPIAAAAASHDKRSLRSHDGGSRVKSDLATYFASYDDIIAGVPPPAPVLDAHTPLYVLDEPVSPRPHPDPRPEPAPHASTHYHVLDYTALLDSLRSHADPDPDPLADAHYFAHHRRAERKEKQLRNIEKERAMHEKLQLERLLDGLQGPDWLKVMGVTGVTDGERKDWEPKRHFFVKEVEALVDKFRVWKEQEKRLRHLAEREARREEEDEADEDTSSNDNDDEQHHAPASTSPHSLPSRTKPPVPRRPPRPHGFLLPYIAPEPAAPFTSFYAKTPHLRAAALGRHRHGRNATAFGLALPEVEEREFQVPDDYIEPGFLRDNARQRRRRLRESRGEGK